MLQRRPQRAWPLADGSFRQQPNFQMRQPEQRPFFQQMPEQRQMNPFQRQHRSAKEQPQKEGLLGKLFGTSNQHTAPRNVFAPPSHVQQQTRNSSGFLDTLKNPEGLSHILTNTQKVLQAAEQFTPMIQQYGPIVKNLPSIWKIMRAFNSSEDDKEKTKTPVKEKTTSKRKQQASVNSSVTKTKSATSKKKNGSVPKLYV